MPIPELLGVIFGVLTISILVSSLARWLLKKSKPNISYKKKNIIAVLVSPATSLLISPLNFLIYAIVAIPIYYVQNQADQKALHYKKPKDK
jgi:hypothetical protein